MNFLELSPYPIGPSHFISADAMARVRFGRVDSTDNHIVMYVTLIGTTSEAVYHPVDKDGAAVKEKITTTTAASGFKAWIGNIRAVRSAVR